MKRYRNRWFAHESGPRYDEAVDQKPVTSDTGVGCLIPGVIQPLIFFPGSSLGGGCEGNPTPPFSAGIIVSFR